MEAIGATGWKLCDPKGDLVFVITQSSAINNPPCGSNDSTSGANPVMRIAASSKHVTLASPVLAAILSTNFAEGISLKANGFARIFLQDNPSAFAIIMDIVHARNNWVPLEVDLATLTNLALIVDKYQMHNAISYFANIWIDNLKVKNDDKSVFGDMEVTLRWIAIAWVFQNKEQFKKHTGIAKNMASGALLRAEKMNQLIYELPLPDNLIEDMCTFYQNSMAHLVDTYSYMISRLGHDGVIICPNSREDCDSMILGYLIRKGQAFGLFPEPAPPFGELRLGEILRKMKAVKPKKTCKSSHGGMNHGVSEMFEAAVGRVEKDMEGWELRHYLRA
ncbi:hypothetical protein BJ875DRAFT_544183 [Amylocarpus encephaloides]|uniref:BTB domain-containing protein n=1 Tax=Amylocarpus encephaloides TaxID=45428 RepID=A0A9P8C488_9HELO|nr:hypothetical protein BJ875DRAFT_544183 [Amylocarpus encephaloides]